MAQLRLSLPVTVSLRSGGNLNSSQLPSSGVQMLSLPHQVRKLAHAIVFIVLICCFSNSGAAYFCPFLLELPLPRGSAEAGVAETWVLDDGERTPPGGSAEAGGRRRGCSMTASARHLRQRSVYSTSASAAHRPAAQPGGAICQVDKRDGVELKDM